MCTIATRSGIRAPCLASIVYGVGWASRVISPRPHQVQAATSPKRSSATCCWSLTGCAIQPLLRLSSNDHFGSQGKRVLATASASCRPWFAICAPILYRKIFVRSSSISKLIEDLSMAGSQIARHARDLSIHGSFPWRTLPRLLTLLPHVGVLRIRTLSGTELVGVDAYHLTHPRVTFGVFVASRTSLTLTELQLYSQRFYSAADVLQLLASFPRLSTASLRSCSIRPGSGSLPSVSTTNLRKLDIHPSEGQHDIREVIYLLSCCRWSHPTTSAVGSYPGLHAADFQTVLEMMTLLSRSLSLHDVM